MRLNDISSGIIVNKLTLNPRHDAILWIPDITTSFIGHLSLSSWGLSNVHTIFLPPSISIIKTWSLQKYNKTLIRNNVTHLQYINNYNTLLQSKKSFIWDTSALYMSVDTQYGHLYNVSFHKKFIMYLVNWFVNNFNDFSNKWLFFVTTTKDWQSHSSVNISSLMKHRIYNLFSLSSGTYAKVLQENTFNLIPNVTGIMTGIYNEKLDKSYWLCVQKNQKSVITKVFSFLNNRISKEKIEYSSLDTSTKESDGLDHLHNVSDKVTKYVKKNLTQKISALKTFDDKTIKNLIEIYAAENPNDEDISAIANNKITHSNAISLLSKTLSYALNNNVNLNTDNIQTLQKIIKDNNLVLKEISHNVVDILPGTSIKITSQLIQRDNNILEKKLNSLAKNYNNWNIDIISIVKTPLENSNEVTSSELERWTFTVKDTEINKSYKISVDVPVIKNGTILYNNNRYSIRHKFAPKLITVPKPFTVSYYGPLTNFYIILRNIRKKDVFYIKYGSYSFPLLPLLCAIFEPSKVFDHFKIKFDYVLKENGIKNKDSSLQFYPTTSLQENLINGLLSNVPKNGDLSKKATWSEYINDLRKDISFVKKIDFVLHLTQEPKTKLFMSSLHKDSSPLDIVSYMCELAFSIQSTISTDISSLQLTTLDWDDIVFKNILQMIHVNRIRYAIKLQPITIPTNILIHTLLTEGYISYTSALNPIMHISNNASVSFSHISSFAPFTYRDFYKSAEGIIDPIDTPSGDNVGITQRFTIGSYVLGNKDVLTLNKNYPFSYAISTIPFARFNDGNRLQMAANHSRQAVPLVYSEGAYIQTGIEPYINKLSPYKIYASCNGIIEKVTDNEIILKCEKSNNKYTYSIEPVPIASNYLLHWNVKCKQSQKVEINSELANADEFHSRGALTLGTNLYATYVNSPWLYEDAIIISENATEKLLSSGGTKFTVKLFDHQYLSYLCNENQLLNRGDPILIIGGSILSAEDMINDWKHQDVLYTIENNKIYYTSPKQLKVIKINIYISKKIQETDKLLYVRWQEQLKKINNVAFDLNEIRNELTYKGVKVNAVIEITLEWNDKCIIGSKLTNRHGLKGVVSRIYSSKEMPKDDNGKPFEILLNPTSLLSRKNLGQLYELYLSNFAYYINEKITKMRADHVEEKQIVKWFTEIYSKIDHTKNKILLKMALVHFFNGDLIPIYVPPFNEFSYSQIKQLLTQYGVEYLTHLHYATKIVSNTKVPKGYLYIYRLYHEPFEKESARAIGSYTPLGHATAGRIRMGGQKIDEQTTWALASYEVPNLLKEFFTVSSVDIESKKKAWLQIIKSGHVSLKELPIKSYSRQYLQSILSSLGLEYI